MRGSVLSTGLAVALVSGAVRAADEPRLADTTERLTADEAKALRGAVLGSRPGTGTPDLQEFPPRRVLVVPREVEAVYKAKPQATVRLLLKIAEGGRALDSLHAVCLIEALVKSPEFAAITAEGVNADKWDGLIGGSNPLTFREHSCQVCVKLIAEKEARE